MQVDRKTTLLIVDDEPPIRKLLEKVALRAGFDVDTARDGIEALQMLEQKQYDMAIVDLMMPRLSGYELVEKISAMNPRPVVLVATAMASSDVSKIDDSLVRRVIRKPFDVTALADALIETAKQIAAKPTNEPVIHVSADGAAKKEAETETPDESPPKPKTNDEQTGC